MQDSPVLVCGCHLCSNCFGHRDECADSGISSRGVVNRIGAALENEDSQGAIPPLFDCANESHPRECPTNLCEAEVNLI